MIKIFFSFLYLLFASWVISEIDLFLLRRIIAAIFAAILGGGLAFGFLDDTFMSFLIVFPGFLFLCLLPIQIERKKLGPRRKIH